MAPSTLETFLGRLRQAMAAEALADCPDRELVERLRAGPDEAAFRAVLNRHGPMVYGVCRRALNCTADVEDAFQATFLVLVRRGHMLRRRDSLGGWLHRVARRTALKLSLQADRRRQRESRVAKSEQSGIPDDTSWGEVRGVLDEELERLPGPCRDALVMCYLEGRTQDEAASHLAISKSTVRRHLDRGRELLGRRLARRGLTFGATLGARLVSDCAHGADLPRELLMRTIGFASPTTGRAAPVVVSDRVAAITEGVTRTMQYAMYKSVVAMVACGLVFGFGLNRFGPLPVSAQDKVAVPAARPSDAVPDIEPIDPHLVFDKEVQKELRLSPNQIQRLGDARDKGTAAAADQSKLVTEIDQRLRKLQDEIERLNLERSTALQAVQKSQGDQLKAALPAVLSKDAVRQLRHMTLQRMRLADVLLDAKVRARLGLDDEQVKKIQELAEKGGAGWIVLDYPFPSQALRATQPTSTFQTIATFLGQSGNGAQADLMKVLTPQQREALEQLSGIKPAPSK